MVKKNSYLLFNSNNKNITFSILIAVILILSSFSCTNRENKLVSFNSIFTKVDSVLLGDNNSISQPIDVVRLNDSSFVFTDFWARSIFYFNRNTRKIQRIGRTGRGPGEYIWPDKLHLNDGKILFSDFQTRTIQEIDSRGKYYGKVVCNAPIRRFCIDDSLNYYILSSTDYQLLVFNRNGILKRKLFPVNKKYKYPIFKIHGGGTCYDRNGHIFFTNVVGSKINKVKVDDLSIVQEFSRRKSPFFKETPRALQGDYYLNLDMEKRHKLLDKITTILNMYFIELHFCTFNQERYHFKVFSN